MGRKTGRGPRTTGLTMGEYAAFLRGINVGGHAVVPMEKLKRVFESLRFKNVRTLLASGNVVFQAPAAPAPALEKKIEEALKDVLGREIGVIVRSAEALQRLAASRLLKGINVTPQTRIYVTFLKEKPEKKPPLPRKSPEGHLQILRATPGEVFSVLTFAPGGRTVDLMQVLEKEFGRGITTRNYTTVLRVLKSLPRGTA